MSARLNLQKLLLVVTLVFSFFLSALVPTKVAAQNACNPSILDHNIEATYFDDDPDNSMNITVNNLINGSLYSIRVIDSTGLALSDVQINSGGNGQITTIISASLDPDVFDYDVGLVGSVPGFRRVTLFGDGIGVCEIATFYIIEESLILDDYEVYQNIGGQQCSEKNGGCLNTTQPIVFETRIISASTGDGVPDLNILHNRSGAGNQLPATYLGNGVYRSSHPPMDDGTYTMYVEENGTLSNPDIGDFSFTVSIDCDSCVPPGDITDDSVNPVEDIYNFCNQINDASQRADCLDCAGGRGDYNGVWTAVGCISREPTSIARTFIRIGLAMSGGVALLMILGAGFILATSEGDPKRTSEAKEMVTAAVVGLLFVIFSVVILQFIGFTILQIPGFGG